MINLDTKTNTSFFRDKKYNISDKELINENYVNITLEDYGTFTFEKKDVTIDNKPCYDSYFIDIEKEIEKNNQLQYNELRPTDWYFIRLQETGEAVPDEILQERIAIRLKYSIK